MPTSLGPAEILVILVVALIVLGPKRLPEAGRQVGKAVAEVRKWSQTFQDEIKSTLDPKPSPPSYSQSQPGYDPPPIPIVPAETTPPADAGASTDPADAATEPADSGPVDSGPVDWADEPTYTDPGPGATPTVADARPTEPAPMEAPGAGAGDPPRT